MLLAPQHFQLLSSRYEHLLEQAAVAGPLPGYGWRTLSIDRGRLLAGQFRLLEADGILPNGFRLRVTPEEGLEVDLAAWREMLRSKPMTVYLGVPARRALVTSGELARYRSAETGPVRDETGESEITVPVLRPNLELFVGESLPARLEGLPVARIRFDDEAFRLEEYQAPTMALSRSSGLHGECRAAVAQVREKALTLADRLSGGSLAADSGELWSARLQLRSLSAALPGLEALLALDSVHPQSLYLRMCDLAGHMASLSHALVPPLFPPYQHLDPASCLTPVIRYVSQSLAEGISENWHRVRMLWEEGRFRIPADSWWDALLRDSADGASGPRAVVALRGPAEAMQRWCAEALISCSSVRDGLVDARALGAARGPLPYLEGLNPAPGVHLFAIEVSPAVFRIGDDVIIEGSPAIQPTPAEAVLHVRKHLGPAKVARQVHG